MSSGKVAASAPGPPKDLDAHLRSLDNIPLFMRELPDESEEDDMQGVSQHTLDALQSLTFDGTPDEVAANFKKQGNDYFLGKRFIDARSFYTQALDAYPTDTKLKETLLLNRAACNLALENFGHTLKDCSAALAINPKSIKAFYRSAKAFSSLSRYTEAIDCCEHALQIDRSDREVLQLFGTIQLRAKQEQRRKDESEERKRRKEEEDTALTQGYLSRGLYVQRSERPPENPNPAHFDSDALVGTSSDAKLPLLNPDGSRNAQWRSPDPIRTPIVFPLVFLYPQHRQSDLISHFHEDTRLDEQLDTIFPSSAADRGQQTPPWDLQGQYKTNNLSVFATTKAQRLLRVGKRLTLREAIDHCATDANKDAGSEMDGMILRDGILSLIVVPKGEAEKTWIATFKSQREKLTKCT